jgi:23S rRNA (cytidine1920-2'-O)/16S rRNA (cytidine1409-2'-O)-methyltransferase
VLHQEVCERIRVWFNRQQGWSVLGIVESPVLGPEGNKEFLIAVRKEGS